MKSLPRTLRTVLTGALDEWYYLVMLIVRRDRITNELMLCLNEQRVDYDELIDRYNTVKIERNELQAKNNELHAEIARLLSQLHAGSDDG